MKKLFLKNVLFSLLFILFLFFSCSKNQVDNSDTDEISNQTETEHTMINEERWISGSDGLRIHTRPDNSSETLATIPRGEKVLLLEETGEEITIADETGRWSLIKWEGEEGWVFGGFLSKEELSSYIDGSPFCFLFSDQDHNWWLSDERGKEIMKLPADIFLDRGVKRDIIISPDHNMVAYLDLESGYILRIYSIIEDRQTVVKTVDTNEIPDAGIFDKDMYIIGFTGDSNYLIFNVFDRSQNNNMTNTYFLYNINNGTEEHLNIDNIDFYYFLHDSSDAYCRFTYSTDVFKTDVPGFFRNNNTGNKIFNFDFTNVNQSDYSESYLVYSDSDYTGDYSKIILYNLNTDTTENISGIGRYTEYQWPYMVLNNKYVIYEDNERVEKRGGGFTMIPHIISYNIEDNSKIEIFTGWVRSIYGEWILYEYEKKWFTFNIETKEKYELSTADAFR